MDFRFHRSERLKSEKIISQLFKKGKSFSCYPLRLVYSEIEVSPSKEVWTDKKTERPADSSPVLFSLSVSKKNFKHAVDRNVLRRRVREAYRLHKHELYNILKSNELNVHKQFAFMVIYTAKEPLPYKEIEKGIRKMILKFKQELGN